MKNTEQIKELGKKKIDYNKIAARFGKAEADDMLSYWILEYNESQKDKSFILNEAIAALADIKRKSYTGIINEIATSVLDKASQI